MSHWRTRPPVCEPPCCGHLRMAYGHGTLAARPQPGTSRRQSLPGWRGIDRDRGGWGHALTPTAPTGKLTAMTKGSDLLVAALENEGVDRIFGIPGEENLDVVESLRASSIQLVLTRHEQAAAFMAATHGRLTGRPGVCIATLGPG